MLIFYKKKRPIFEIINEKKKEEETIVNNVGTQMEKRSVQPVTNNINFFNSPSFIQLENFNHLNYYANMLGMKPMNDNIFTTYEMLINQLKFNDVIKNPMYRPNFYK
jgi:hypothetical protein